MFVGRDVQGLKARDCRHSDTLETRVFDKCMNMPGSSGILNGIIALRDMESSLYDIRREIFWISVLTKNVLSSLLLKIRTIIKHYVTTMNPDDGMKIVEKHRNIFLLVPMDDPATYPQAIDLLKELIADLIGNCETLVYANVLALSKVFGVK